MDMEALQSWKKVKVFEHCPAVLKGFKMVFSLPGLPFVEPGFGGLCRQEDEEVHGVAFKMDEESVARLDDKEAESYTKEIVKLTAYDGRELEGYVYMSPTTEEWLPSERYLGVLCKGARQAGLDPAYIEKLASLPVYRAEEQPRVVAARRAREDARGGLRQVSRAELEEHKTSDPWVSCLGFVIRPDPGTSEPEWLTKMGHSGRDFTTKWLLHLHGIPMDDFDDGGAPPYPLVDKLATHEVGIRNLHTNNLLSCSDRVPGQLGGLLSDFEAGRTDWDFEGVSGSTGARSHSVCSPSVSKENVKY